MVPIRKTHGTWTRQNTACIRVANLLGFTACVRLNAEAEQNIVIIFNINKTSLDDKQRQQQQQTVIWVSILYIDRAVVEIVLLMSRPKFVDQLILTGFPLWCKPQQQQKDRIIVPIEVSVNWPNEVILNRKDIHAVDKNHGKNNVSHNKGYRLCPLPIRWLIFYRFHMSS